MPPSNERRPRFEEQAALEELERLRRALEHSRQRRKQANEEFDTFLRSFQRRPDAPSLPRAEPQAPSRYARAVDPRPVDIPVPAPPPPLTRRPDRPAVEPPAPPLADPATTDVPPAPPAGATADIPAAVAVEAPRTPSRNRALAGLAVVIAAAAVFLLARVFSPGGGSSPASSPPAQDAGAPAASPPASLSTPPPAPTAAVDDPPTQLITLRHVWVRVTADGVKRLERELPPDSRIPIDAKESIVIRAGDAGAVRMVIDGKDQGPLGPDGVARTRTFTPSR